MEENKLQLVRNFWILGRKAQDAANVLAVPLEEIQKLYQQWNDHRENMARAIMRLRGTVLLLLSLLSLLAVGSLHAQTVSPVIVELAGKKATVSGSFTISNGGVIPMTVVVEPPLSLTFKDGQPRLQKPLAPGVTLELNEQSAKVGARQSHTFWYRLTCLQKPCAVTLYSTLTGTHTPSGVAIAVHLPHTIYFCSKQKGCRSSVVEGKPIDLNGVGQ